VWHVKQSAPLGGRADPLLETRGRDPVGLLDVHRSGFGHSCVHSGSNRAERGDLFAFFQGNHDRLLFGGVRSDAGYETSSFAKQQRLS